MPLTDYLMDQTELFDLANDAIILSDGNGAITYWNKGACRIYGWEKEQALGQNVHALLKTELSGDGRNPEALLKDQTCWEGELFQVRRDGKRILVASRWTTDAENPASARLQINTDITTKRQEETGLRESEEHYRRFVTQDFTGTLSILPNGQIVTCNPAFANIFGFNSIEEALSGNFIELLRSRKDAADLLEMVRQHGIVERHELEMSQHGVDPVYVVARLVGSFADHNLAELQAYLFNDTKRKRLEQQLIQ